MLTGDLVRATARAGDVRPSYVDPEKPAILERAASLLDILRQARDERWRRGEIDESLSAWEGDSRDVKLLRGLAKLALDRCTFEVDCPVSPAELRARVFALAVERGPLSLTRGALRPVVAEDLLAEVGASLGITGEAAAEALYGDHEEMKRLSGAELPDASGLLHRYNLALVQALLLSARDVHVVIEKPPPERVRQLFRAVKFHQLLHRAIVHEHALELVLDGPLSLFEQGTRYGLQLALFVPTLALFPGSWSLTAEVRTGRERTFRRLRVTQDDGLRSHLADRGAYRTREHEWFEERFAAKSDGWTLSAAERPVSLGRAGAMMPDWTLRKDGREAHVELLGFWRREDVEKKAALLAEHGRHDVILAVSRRHRADGAKDALPDGIVTFAEVLSPKHVLEVAERVARPFTAS